MLTQLLGKNKFDFLLFKTTFKIEYENLRHKLKLILSYCMVHKPHSVNFGSKMEEAKHISRKNIFSSTLKLGMHFKILYLPYDLQKNERIRGIQAQSAQQTPLR